MSESDTGGPLADMSEKLTAETDVNYDGADIVVTKGPNVDGNEVTVVLHDETEADADPETVVVGFDAEGFEELARRLATNAEAGWCELEAEDRRALGNALHAAEHELSVDEAERLQWIRQAAPKNMGGETDA
jgi:hypothetical protein